MAFSSVSITSGSGGSATPIYVICPSNNGSVRSEDRILKNSLGQNKITVVQEGKEYYINVSYYAETRLVLEHPSIFGININFYIDETNMADHPTTNLIKMTFNITVVASGRQYNFSTSLPSMNKGKLLGASHFFTNENIESDYPPMVNVDGGYTGLLPAPKFNFSIGRSL